MRYPLQGIKLWKHFGIVHANINVIPFSHIWEHILNCEWSCMQIAVSVEIVAVCANFSLDFLKVCYLTIKAIEMNADYYKTLKNKEKSEYFRSSWCLRHWQLTVFITIHMNRYLFRWFKIGWVFLLRK